MQELKHIIDLETLLGYKLSKIDFSDVTNENINYSWGDESELISWIKSKDDNSKFGGNFYTIANGVNTLIDKSKKYPLIWLATPVKGENNSDIKRFDNISIIICTNTEFSLLNKDRWGKNIPILQGIADKIIDKLKGSLRIVRNNGVLEYSYRNMPKYGVSETVNSENKAIDLWDAVVIETSLIASNSCADEDYFKFYNNN